MRYLRKQVINRRAPWDQRLQVDINNNVLMATPAALQLPAGTTLERPIAGNLYGSNNPTDIRGMIRYNTETDQLEGYQDGVWRSFRFKESTGITQQNVGTGDAIETVFGPLSPSMPAVAESGVTWDLVQYAKNLLVIVENVIQVSGTNYSVVQNPVGKPTGYYLNFSSPVPLGKPVIVLHGFDR